MAIPFFILAGNFLTHGGVARRMINFATSMVGHWYGGLALSGVLGLCAFCRCFVALRPPPLSPSVPFFIPGMVKAGFPDAVRRRCHCHLRSARTSSSPRPLLWSCMLSPPTPRWAPCSCPGLFLYLLASTLGGITWYRARKYNYPRQAKASWGDRLPPSRESAWGLMLIIVVMGASIRGFLHERKPQR